MLLKELYSKEFYLHFCDMMEEVLPSFDRRKFLKQIFVSHWEEMELKQRMKHTSAVLRSMFPDDFRKSAGIISDTILLLQERGITGKGLEYMFLPDYIETYGIGDFQTSVKTMETVTTYTSCEFAVRPFLIRYGDRMMKQMERWSRHRNHHVRRLSSEGSRPRLPWAMAVPELKKNPRPVLPILENLKQDPSEYVRRSVANNLNDIAKDHPQLVVEMASRWKGISRETDAIIKHGCRTLLKQGHPHILRHFDLNNSKHFQLSDFKIHSLRIRSGATLEFSFSVRNGSNKPQNLRLEYAMYFLRQNGTHSKKVFKISERLPAGGEVVDVKRKYSFRPITTRRYYPGKHRISVIINGKESETKEFVLV